MTWWQQGLERTTKHDGALHEFRMCNERGGSGSEEFDAACGAAFATAQHLCSGKGKGKGKGGAGVGVAPTQGDAVMFFNHARPAASRKASILLP